MHKEQEYLLYELIQKGFRIFILLKRAFKEKKITSLAQSLSYTTILSLVPILAIFFSVLGIITKNTSVQNTIKSFISVYFFPEYVNTMFQKLENLSHDSFTLGAIGFPTLFLAGVFLYVKVDSSVNSIWHSQKEKKWFKNSLAFFMTLFFGPMLLVLVFSIPTYLQTIPLYHQFLELPLVSSLMTPLIPLVISTLGLFVLYSYIPAVHVRYSAAIRGAFIASVLIQISNVFISWFLKNFSKFDLLYGSLAIMPIFLLWVFVLWLIVLTGAALAYIFQFHNETNYVDLGGMYNDESLLCSALKVMVFLCKSFEKKDNAPDFDQIHLMLGLNRNRLKHILDILLKEKLIVSYQDKSIKGQFVLRYQPGVLPDNILLKTLIPLFYHMRESLFFSKELNSLLMDLEIHPKFYEDNITLGSIAQLNKVSELTK